jgi:hypothetical protein
MQVQDVRRRAAAWPRWCARSDAIGAPAVVSPLIITAFTCVQPLFFELRDLRYNGVRRPLLVFRVSRSAVAGLVQAVLRA